MMGRKLRFCTALLVLLFAVAAVAVPAEAAKKKKKKATKPKQQTTQSQSVNPVGYYEKARGGGRGRGDYDPLG